MEVEMIDFKLSAGANPSRQLMAEIKRLIERNLVVFNIVPTRYYLDAKSLVPIEGIFMAVDASRVGQCIFAPHIERGPAPVESNVRPVDVPRHVPIDQQQWQEMSPKEKDEFMRNAGHEAPRVTLKCPAHFSKEVWDAMSLEEKIVGFYKRPAGIPLAKWLKMSQLERRTAANLADADKDSKP